MKFLPLALIGVAVLLAFCCAAYPIHVKGEPAWQDYLNLIQARNKALAGTYAYESANGIYLSSQRAATDGVPTAMPNALTAIIYGKLFTWFGFDQRLPIYSGIALFAVSTALVAFLATRLFGATVGVLSGGLFAFMPLAVSSASTGGSYEFGMLFFLSGLLLYLGSRRGPFAAPWWRLVLASILFALSALARNAFAVSLVPIVAYDLFTTRSLKRLACLAIPIALLFGSTLTPYSWLGVENGYFATQNQPFQQVGHFFVDPYSAIYDRDASIQRSLSTPGGTNRIDTNFLVHWGVPVPFSRVVSAYWSSFSYYVTEALPPWEYGGPLILALAFGGFMVLWRRDRRFSLLVVSWLAFWLAYLVYARSANWDHYLEILFPFVVSAALGILWVYEAFMGRGLRPLMAGTLIGVAVVGTLVYGAKWRFGQQYDNPAYQRGVVARQIVEAYKGKGTIALGIHNEVAYGVAYATNRDIILFADETVNRLASEGKLRAAFRQYGVTLAVGFDPSLSGAAGVPIVPVP